MRREDVGVMKGKEVKLQDVDAPHTLRYINLAIEPEAGLGNENQWTFVHV
jgi:hypothetical protein